MRGMGTTRTGMGMGKDNRDGNGDRDEDANYQDDHHHNHDNNAMHMMNVLILGVCASLIVLLDTFFGDYFSCFPLWLIR